MADLRSGTMAWTYPIGPSTSDRRSIRLPSLRINASVQYSPTLPRNRRVGHVAVGQGTAAAWPAQSHVQGRIGRSKVVSGGGCAIRGSARHPRRYPFTPQPGKAATTTPQTVTFVTGAKSDFSKWL